LSYYSTTVRLGPDGDVLLSEDTFESIGIQRFLKSFFGSLIAIAHPPQPHRAPYSYEPSKPRLDEGEGVPSPKVILHSPVTLAEPIELPPTDWTKWESVRPVLIACIPTSGYFVAGGLAGITSRTTTAPLDRLKVYLFANTNVSGNGLQALKSMNPLIATKSLWSTSSAAMKDLWAAGGVRSLYAGGLLSDLSWLMYTNI
jgi:solute carrier family 25 (mitochondrial phosphate transporter), member 23/24/25/41